MSDFWVSEHGRIYRGASSERRANGDLQLADDDFDAMLDLLDEGSETEPGLDPVFKCSRIHGRDLLTVQQYVGVIRTDSGCQIEILPKTSKRSDLKSARDLLVKMLIELRESPFREGTLADLEAHDMPLFELVMRQFLEHVGDIVRKGIARTYVEREANLIFLRGKLQLTEHIRRNSYLQSHVFCQFEEFDIDRPINRLIKAALAIVDKVTRDAANQLHCRELMFWFDNVPASIDYELDFRAVRQDRLVRHYEPAMPGCRLILERLNPLTQHGSRRAVSMLFPMSRVFEDYVAARLPQQLKGCRVHSQVRGQALIDRHINRPMFNLIPDLEIRLADETLIADTKWKLLDDSDRSNRYGISQPDIYQLFAYSRKYLAKQSMRRVVLIYPLTDSFRNPLQPFWYKEGEEVLYVLPFDLEAGRLAVDGLEGLH